MPESFKTSNYVKIVQDIVPELNTASNPYEIGHLKTFPSLKHVVVINNKQVNGMIKFEDLFTLATDQHTTILLEREKHINSLDATNIQFTSGTTGYPKGAILTHFNLLNNA